jgi:ubiquitin-activating enzyme E1 C
VLVVGAGGLGCEILKDLAMSGFGDITVVDMDTIDISNLNRQFLFRKKDIGKPKSTIAAQFIMQRFPDVKINGILGMVGVAPKKKSSDDESKNGGEQKATIQTFDDKWYTQFHCIIAGLDSDVARLALNDIVHRNVRFDTDGELDWETVVPMIDGGTEGFQGQVRMIIPFSGGSCLTCQRKFVNPDEGHFHLCTIANKPRIPEHCIFYASEVLWDRLIEFNSVDDYKMRAVGDDEDVTKKAEAGAPRGKVKLDKDNMHHMSWLFNRAQERAEKYNIQGVTYKLTMQAVKNIIPAVACSNALISAGVVNEAVKYITDAGPSLDNFFRYRGAEQPGVTAATYSVQRESDCAVCRVPQKLNFKKDCEWGEVIAKLKSELKADTITVLNAGSPVYQSGNADDESDLERMAVKMLSATDRIVTVYFKIKQKKSVNNAFTFLVVLA